MMWWNHEVYILHKVCLKFLLQVYAEHVFEIKV